MNLPICDIHPRQNVCKPKRTLVSVTTLNPNDLQSSTLGSSKSSKQTLQRTSSDNAFTSSESDIVN